MSMIEMRVRAVKRTDGDRLVAVLERDGTAAAAGRLLVTLSRAEAHVIYHELRAEKTLPGQAYELIADVVAQLQGRLTAVELIAGEAGKPSARLRVERTDGRSAVPTRAGQALALAVHLKVPLLVADALLRAPARAETGADGPLDDPEQSIEVPEVFLRAFDE
jgi:bifunctional DNase/RNase